MHDHSIDILKDFYNFFLVIDEKEILTEYQQDEKHFMLIQKKLTDYKLRKKKGETKNSLTRFKNKNLFQQNEKIIKKHH